MNAILVLGMHRSGTSVLARTLNLLGCDLGPHLIPPAADNESGFWEHRDVVLLDDEILARLASRWDDPRPIDPSRFQDAAMAPLRDRARAILARDFSGVPLWGMKDPRLCRLLPFWLPLIEESGAAARFVIALRHPCEVARSLRTRNGFSVVKSERLWLAHVLDAERWTRGRPRTFVTYDQLMEDWRTHLTRLAREIGLFDAAVIERAQDQIARFVDPTLRHHGADDRREIATPEAREAWAALSQGAPDSLDGVAALHAADALRHREASVSIVVVTRNGIEHTKRCLDSVARNTPENHEVIVVDNGSTDGTVSYLEQRAKSERRLRLVHNGTNRGFAAANNQGLAVAQGDFLVALNNDVIVSPGWLGRMLAVMDEHPEVGIVGPTTNRASGPQVVPVEYTTLAGMEAHARSVARAHAGETMEARRLVAFCWVVRRSLVERIGGFDERFETGNCEDDDFCLRAVQAGYRARIARDTFVHHEGSVTFRAENVDYSALLARNFDVFKSKWGMDPAARAEDGYPFVELAAKADRPRVPLPESASGNVRLQAGILPGHDPIPAMRAFFQGCGHGSAPHWASAAALDDELRRSDFALVLGGDVYFTEDALRALVSILRAHPKIAAIGPVSNAAPPLQCVAPKYSDLDRDLRRFVERRAKKYQGIWHDAPDLAAFAVLVRGDAVRAVGGLAREAPIAHALSDFYTRARAAGHRVGCAPGVYVHHAKCTPDEAALPES